MINPPFDREKQRKKYFQYLENAAGEFRTKLKMLCPESLERDEALLHVAQSVVCIKKGIEADLDVRDDKR